MLKVIGSLAFSILVSFNLSANPISFNNQENTYATVISTKGNTIPAATIDLLLKDRNTRTEDHIKFIKQ